MKNMLLFAFVLVSSSGYFAQKKIIIKYAKTELIQLDGNNHYQQVLDEGDKSMIRSEEGTKIIDFYNMETDYYENGELKKSFKIKSIVKEGPLYIIKYNEEDLRNGNPLETIQVIDTKRKKSYYCWYYDGSSDVTFVVNEKKLHMKVEK